MTTEYEEVCTQLLYIHRGVGYRLRTVYQHRNLVRMGDVDNAPYVVDGAEGVVHMTNGDKACAGRDESFELREY